MSANATPSSSSFQKGLFVAVIVVLCCFTFCVFFFLFARVVANGYGMLHKQRKRSRKVEREKSNQQQLNQNQNTELTPRTTRHYATHNTHTHTHNALKACELE